MQQGIDFAVVGHWGLRLVHEGDIGAEDAEKTEGVFVTEVAFVPEAIEGGLRGLEEKAAEARVGGAADFVLTMIEFADEGGKALPLVDGGAVEAKDGSDSRNRVA